MSARDDLPPDAEHPINYRKAFGGSAPPKPAPDAMRKALARLVEMDDDAAAASGKKGNLNGLGLVDMFDLVGHPFGVGKHKQQPYRSNQLEVALADARAALSAPVPPPDGAAEDQYRHFVIRKKGYFYRANARGYCADPKAAGRFTYEEAEKLTADVEGATLHRAEEFQPPPPSDDVRSALQLARDDLERVAVDGDDFQQTIAAIDAALRSPVSAPARGAVDDEDLRLCYVNDQGCSNYLGVDDPAVCGLVADGGTCTCLETVRMLRDLIERPGPSAPAVGVTREAIARIIDPRALSGGLPALHGWAREEAYKKADAILALRSPAPDATVSEPVEHRWLNDLLRTAEAFRIATIFSGALDKVGQDKYIDQLRALETALNPFNYRSGTSPQHVGREAAVSARDAVIEECANIALAIDSGRGNEKEIAKAIRSLTGAKP